VTNASNRAFWDIIISKRVSSEYWVVEVSGKDIVGKGAKEWAEKAGQGATELLYKS